MLAELLSIQVQSSDNSQYQAGYNRIASFISINYKSIVSKHLDSLIQYLMNQEFEFYLPEEQIFSKTIHQEYEQHQFPSVILSGFPYDQGTKRNGGRIGGSIASTIFRKTLTNLELYPTQKVQVYDTGDIESQLQLEKAHIILEEKHKRLLQKNKNSLLVSIGGSNDQSYPNAAALLSVTSNKVGVVNIDAHFDVRPLKEGKAHSGSPFRLLLQDPRFLSNGGKFVQFACKGASCSIAHCQYLQSKGCQIYWMEQTIRRHKVDNQSKWRTQGGQSFAKLMAELQSQCQTIFVSIDVDSINSKWMPGVSAPSVVGGLTSEQALQIVSIAGLSKKVRLVDFSQFNPAVQSVMSGHLLGELFFQLCMKFGERL